jgi:hypothetical protein
MTTLQELGPTVQLSQRKKITLVVGDIIAFLVFAAIGRNSHNEFAGAAELLAIVKTASPFIMGWFVVAIFVGTYRPDVVNKLKPMLMYSVLGWLIAWPIGLALRALMLWKGIPLSFALVTLGSMMLIMLIWRTLFATVLAKRLD